MNEPDELDEILRPHSNEASATFREGLRNATSRVVRQKPIVQLIGRVVSLALAFVVGGAAVWLARPAAEVKLVFVDRSIERSSPPTPPQIPNSPHELELAAEQADGVESARLFLDAGRVYGGRFNDWAAALRCYRNALELDPSLAVKSDPNTDDWLLVKLKNDWRYRDANP